jgi:shikimate kinase
VLLLECDRATLQQRQQQNTRPPLTQHQLGQEIAVIDARRQEWYAQCADGQVDSSLSIAESIEQARVFFIN